MPSKKRQLQDSRLYLILDKAVCGRRDTKKVLEQAARGGIDLVQFRDKLSPDKAMLAEAFLLSKIARRCGLIFIINDRITVAQGVKADGIHLGQEDMPPASARNILGPRKIIGLSCHSLDEVGGAAAEADYLGFGPVFATATKPDLAPKGVRMLKEAVALDGRPVFAIGGIDAKRIDRICRAGSGRAAVCRAICLSRDIKAAAQNLKKRLK